MIGEKANSKGFFNGRRDGASLSDISLILAKLRESTGSQSIKEYFDEEAWSSMTQIIKYLLAMAL